MPFVDHELNWQFSINNEAYGSSSTAVCQMHLWNIKNALVSFPSNPWTVVGSSNSAAAGMDGVDRWTTSANLVWNTTNRSWIVLKQTGIDTNFQLLIACNSASPYVATIQISSSAGFTGGSISANPTATDAQTLNTGDWGGLGGNGVGTFPYDGCISHIMQTEDGYCTRILGVANINTPGLLNTYMSFERVKNPVQNWTNPYFSTAAGANVNPTGYTSHHGYYLNFTNASGPSNANELISRHSGNSIQLLMTSEGTSSSLLLNALSGKNDISGDFDIYPCGLYCHLSQYRGRVGEVYDFHLGYTGNHLYYYPDASGNEKRWFQVGNIIVPWNGQTATIG